MCKSGSGSSTTTSTSSPPAAFTQAYTDVYNQAKAVSQTPYQQYSGQLVAGFSPDQTAGMTAIENMQGISNPYINSAANYINQSTTPLWSNTQQWSPSNVQQYENPYVQNVVGATQAEFNNINQQQQNQLAGNAVSQGAFGGDRAAVAASTLAGQQLLSQGPWIGGLYSQGYQQAQQQLNTQQQMQLGANEAQAWLNSQAGYGMANLGNQALSSTLTGAEALLGIGSTQQQQAQSLLNVPYQQYTAQQAYPFQTTSWLSGIASGLGSQSGGTSTTTSPSASTVSQVLGTGLTGLGLANSLFSTGSGSSYQSGLQNIGSSLSSLFGSSGTVDTGSFTTAAEGGGIPQFRPSEGVSRGPHLAHRASSGSLGLTSSEMSGSPYQSISIPTGNSDVPNVSASFVPQSSTNTSGTPLILRNYGTTSTTSGSSGSSGILSDLIGLGSLGVKLFGAEGGRVGWRPGNDNWHPDGWRTPHRAAGGSSSGPVTTVSLNAQGVPQLSTSNDWLTSGSSGPLTQPTAASGAQGQGALSSNQSIQNYLSNQQAGASFSPATIYSPSTGTYGKALSPQLMTGFSQPGSGTSPWVTPMVAGSTSTGTTGSTGTSTDSTAAADAALQAFLGTTSSTSSAGGGWSGGPVHRFQDGGGTLPDWAIYDNPRPATITDAPRQVSPSSWATASPDRTSDAPIQASPSSWQSAEAPATETGAGPPEAPEPAPRGTTVAATEAEPQGRGPMGPTGESSMRPQDHGGGEHKTDWGKMLMYIGANIAAGTSPYPLANIGRGVAAGMKQYESEGMLAERLSNQADEIARKLKQGDERNAERTRHDVATETTTREHWQQMGQQGSWVSGYGQDENGNRVPGLYFTPKSGGSPTFHPGMDTVQLENAQQRKAAFDETVRQHNIVDNRQAQADYESRINHMTDQAIRIYNSSKDINGKFTLTPEQAQEKADSIREGARAGAGPRPTAPVQQRTPPQKAIDDLRANPSLAPQFQQWYGVDPRQFLQQPSVPAAPTS